MATSLDMKHKLFAIVPADFRIAPERIKLPDQMTYVPHQVATNKKTGDTFWIVTSSTPEGLKDFQNDFNSSIVRNSLNLKDREDWELNMFSTFDDKQSDFEQIVRKGIAAAERAAADREHRARAIEQIQKIDQERIIKVREEQNRMYGSRRK